MINKQFEIIKQRMKHIRENCRENHIYEVVCVWEHNNMAINLISNIFLYHTVYRLPIFVILRLYLTNDYICSPNHMTVLKISKLGLRNWVNNISSMYNFWKAKYAICLWLMRPMTFHALNRNRNGNTRVVECIMHGRLYGYTNSNAMKKAVT